MLPAHLDGFTRLAPPVHRYNDKPPRLGQLGIGERSQPRRVSNRAWARYERNDGQEGLSEVDGQARQAGHAGRGVRYV